MGVQALGMGLGTLIRRMGVRPEIVIGHDFRSYSAVDQICPGHRPAGGGMQGARHRPRGDADGLFRPVRSRRALRRHGDGLPQRQWLDRREDGRATPAHLRAGRDDPSQGHRARRQVRPARRRRLSFRGEFSGPLYRRPHRPAQARAPAQGGGGVRQRHRRRVRAAGARSDRLRSGAARLHPRPFVPALQSQSRRHGDAARDPRRGAGEPRRCRPRLRRRRRPLRRGRRRGRGDLRRQGRRHAGARHVEPASKAPSSWST